MTPMWSTWRYGGILRPHSADKVFTRGLPTRAAAHELRHSATLAIHGRLCKQHGTRARYNQQMTSSVLRSFKDKWPNLGERVYVDPLASVGGDVVLGDDVSVWPFTVIRGDVNFVRIGARTNIQDGTIVHVSHDGPHAKLGGFATVIGADVTIGHRAIIHACRIEDACLIGMGAIVMDGAVVKKHGFVGAGTLIAPGKTVGEGELWLGNPGRFARKLTDAEIEGLHYSAAHYVRLKDEYLAALA